MSLGKALLAKGQTERAEQAFAEAAAVGQAAGFVLGTLAATGCEVSVQRLRGARRRALATGQTALDWAAERSHPAAPGVVVLSVLMSDLLRDGDDLAGASPLATDGLRALRDHGGAPHVALVASLSLVRLRLAEGKAAEAAAALNEARPLVGAGPAARLAPLLEACEAEVSLAVGDTAAALAWASAAEPLAPTGLLWLGPPTIYVAGIEALGVTAARVLVAQGRATGDASLLRQAERTLEPAWQLARGHGLGWLGLRVLILRALIADALGDREAALALLERAVVRGGPEKIIRPFADEGTSLAVLLAALRAAAVEGRDVPSRTATYVDMLLAHFPGQTPASLAGRSLVGPPSERELDVLRLLAAGRSNAEMARDLVVEQSTIKTHLINLYGKLGVHSRIQAVARARALQLLE